MPSEGRHRRRLRPRQRLWPHHIRVFRRSVRPAADRPPQWGDEQACGCHQGNQKGWVRWGAKLVPRLDGGWNHVGGDTIARYPLPRNSPDQRRGGVTCWDLGGGKGDHEGVSSIHCRPNLTVSWQARRVEREMVVRMRVGWQRWARRSAGVRGRWGMFAAKERCLHDASLDENSVSFLGFSGRIDVLEMKLITRMSLLVCLLPKMVVSGSQETFLN